MIYVYIVQYIYIVKSLPQTSKWAHPTFHIVTIGGDKAHFFFSFFVFDFSFPAQFEQFFQWKNQCNPSIMLTEITEFISHILIFQTLYLS